MSADELADFYVHEVTVETWQGTNVYGEDIYSAPVTLSPTTDNGVFMDGGRKLVRDKTGQQVVSTTTLYTYPAAKSLFVPDSRVTRDGEIAYVIQVVSNVSGDLDLPDNLAVSLT